MTQTSPETEWWAVLYLHDWDPPKEGQEHKWEPGKNIFPEIHNAYPTWQEAEAVRSRMSNPHSYWVRRVYMRGHAQTPAVSPHQMACLLTILDVMRSAKRQGVGMSVWDRDIQAVEAAVAALSDTSTESK